MSISIDESCHRLDEAVDFLCCIVSVERQSNIWRAFGIEMFAHDDAARGHLLNESIAGWDVKG